MSLDITKLTKKIDKLDKINQLEETEKSILSPFDGNREPKGVYNSAATSGVAAPKDTKYLLKTGKRSHKVLMLPNRKKMNAKEKWH